MLRKVVLIEGSRSPFLKSFTSYKELKQHELFRHSMVSVIQKAGIPFDSVEYVVAGTVVHDAKTSNVARDAILTSPMNPDKTPSHTVTQACISANQAITSAADMIACGKVDVAVAGGVEFLSDPPLKFKRPARKWFLSMNKAKSVGQKLSLMTKLSPSMLIPDDMNVTEFTTGETMGQNCEKLIAMFKVTRNEQDEFAFRSHTLAEKAFNEGKMTDITPIDVPDEGKISKDNGIRVTSMQKLASLKPAYIKPHGSITAANATFLTDGSAATLMMTDDKAKKLNLKPRAQIKDYCYVSVDQLNHLLLGPTHACYKLLTRNKLTLNDIDVFEYHEAFAGQLLANLKALDSDWYTKNEIGNKSNDKLGMIPMDKLNTWGGSVAIGHPFGATGSRLVNMAVNRLNSVQAKYALIAACAGGGHGHAMLIEKYS